MNENFSKLSNDELNKQNRPTHGGIRMENGATYYGYRVDDTFRIEKEGRQIVLDLKIKKDRSSKEGESIIDGELPNKIILSEKAIISLVDQFRERSQIYFTQRNPRACHL